MDNQKTHVVELEFLLLFLPYSFKLIGPQTKQGNMHPCSAKIGLKVVCAPPPTSESTESLTMGLHNNQQASGKNKKIRLVVPY
jgi:hypothetical protein